MLKKRVNVIESSEIPPKQLEITKNPKPLKMDSKGLLKHSKKGTKVIEI